MNLERLDRRLFLRGMMLTSAGLIVPKPVQIFVPEPQWRVVVRGIACPWQHSKTVVFISMNDAAKAFSLAT